MLQAESQEEDEKSFDMDEHEDSGQDKLIQQTQPDLATVIEDDLEPKNGPSGTHPPRAPSPSASHTSSEGISSMKKKDAATPEHASAFGARAQRAFSPQSRGSGDLGRSGSLSKDLDKKLSSGYSGLNPTSTRSASRMLSDPPPTSSKPSAPVTRRDLAANSILQLDVGNELDTFTADIDCLVDSSDGEEQPAAKGKKESGGEDEGQDKAASESSGKAGSSSKKKRGDEEDEDDEGDVSCKQAFL